MAKNINHLQHVKSSVVENGMPKLPAPSVLVEGELAVNYATDKETISLKNSSGDVVTFSSDNYYSEKKLGSWFIGENSGKTVTDVMRDDERIIAAALNDLKENKLDASAYTETDLSDYATKEWVGDRLGSGFTGENSGVTVTKVIEDDERAIAAALTDLDDRKLDASAFTESVGDFYTKEEVDEKLGADFSGTSYEQSVTEVISEIETVTAAALNDLNDRKLDASAYTPTDLSNYYDKDEIDEIIDGVDSRIANRVSSVTINNSTKTPSNGNVNLGTVVSSMTVNGSAVTVTNGAAALTGLATASELLKYADNATYNSNDKKIYFKNGNTTLTSMTIDATDFIKDGMVNDVEVDTPTSGSNSGVTCLIVTFNTDAGKEDIEIPLSEIFDSNLYYTKTEIDDVLGSGFTVSAVTSSVTDVIKENEEVVAEALADLDSRISGNTTYITQVNAKADTIARSLSGYTPSGYSYSKGEVDVKLADKLDASAYTPTDLSGYYTKQEIDEDKLGSGFTGGNSGTTVTDAFNVVERVVAASLTDLDDRKLDASAYTETDLSDYYNKEAIDDKLGEWFSGSSSVTQVLREDELAISSALNDLNDRKLDASAYTQPDLSSYATEQWVEDDVLGSGFTGNNSGRTITEVIEDNELITSAALNDLNERLVDVEENQLTPSSFKTINNESIIGSGNIEIQGGGGGEMNVITGISVNNVEQSPSNKVVNITVPTSLSQITSAHTHSEYINTGSTAQTKNGNLGVNNLIVRGSNTSNSTRFITSDAANNIYASINGTPSLVVTNTEVRRGQSASSINLGSASYPWNNAYAKAFVTSGGTSAQFVKGDGTLDSTVYAVAANTISGVSVNGSAVTVTNNVAAISGVSLEPLVINIGVDDTTVPNGTYAAITAALADNRQVILRCNVDNQQFEYSYLTGDGTNLDEGYYFIGFGISTTEINFANISSSNTLTLGTMEYASASHTHGNITTYGKLQTSDITIANGDKLVVTDASDNSGRVARASVTFDGSTTNKALTPKGTWEAFSPSGHTHAISDVTNLQSTLDGKVSGITMNSAAKTVTNGVVDLGTVITAETTLSTASTGTGSVVTGLTVSNHQITMQKGNVTLDNVADGTTRKLSDYATTGSVNTLSGTVTAHTANTTVHVTSANKTQWDNAISGVSLNGTAASVTNHVAALTGVATTTDLNTHTGNTAIHLPVVTAADNGKILMVVNGAWALVNPTTIYTGTGTPQSGTGNDGDIYLQTS